MEAVTLTGGSTSITRTFQTNSTMVFSAKHFRRSFPNYFCLIFSTVTAACRKARTLYAFVKCTVFNGRLHVNMMSITFISLGNH